MDSARGPGWTAVESRAPLTPDAGARPRRHAPADHRKLLPRGLGGLSALIQYRWPERGARIAKREEREYWRYLSAEQRREAGCPARQAVLKQRGRATSCEGVERPRAADSVLQAPSTPHFPRPSRRTSRALHAVPPAPFTPYLPCLSRRNSCAVHAVPRVPSTPYLGCPSPRTSHALHAVLRAPLTPYFKRYSPPTSRALHCVLPTPSPLPPHVRLDSLSGGPDPGSSRHGVAARKTPSNRLIRQQIHRGFGAVPVGAQNGTAFS
jgi:hypothetical protein